MRLRSAAWIEAGTRELRLAVEAGEAALALEIHAYLRRAVRQREGYRRLCAVRGCHRTTVRRSICAAHDAERRRRGPYLREETCSECGGPFPRQVRGVPMLVCGESCRRRRKARLGRERYRARRGAP